MVKHLVELKHILGDNLPLLCHLTAIFGLQALIGSLDTFFAGLSDLILLSLHFLEVCQSEHWQ